MEGVERCQCDMLHIPAKFLRIPVFPVPAGVSAEE
jgi:hypothetical protein